MSRQAHRLLGAENIPLILFHADPSYDDAALDAMEKQAGEMLDEKGLVIECKVARDGLVMEF